MSSRASLTLAGRTHLRFLHSSPPRTPALATTDAYTSHLTTPELTKDTTAFQASLSARADHIRHMISELRPRLATVKDPAERKEIELKLKELSRRGNFVSAASRELESIISERGQAW